MPDTVDLKTKVLHSAGTRFAPLGGENSTIKCYKDGDNFKLVIELTFPPSENLKLLGEINDPDGNPYSEDQIKAQRGWIYFPKFEKIATQVLEGTGHFMHIEKETVALTTTILLKGGGKTQSGQ